MVIQKLKFPSYLRQPSFWSSLAIPTLQGVVLMNRLPDPNDSQALEKYDLNQKCH